MRRASRTTIIQGNRYVYESECLNCDWTHYAVGGRGRGKAPTYAARRHALTKGHKVRITRTYVIKGLLHNELQD